MQQPSYDFVSHVTRFCRALRRHGMLVGPLETADAIRSLTVVDVMDYGRVYWALRSVLVSRQEEFPIYDELFQGPNGAGKTTDHLDSGRLASAVWPQETKYLPLWHRKVEVIHSL